MPYSLTQAAQAAGRTRQAIQQAIKKGHISATKNQFGEWEIEPAELHRVYPPNKPNGASLTDDLSVADNEKDALVRELRARLEVMEQLCHQLEGERDRERQNHDDTKHQLMALLPAQKTPVIEPELPQTSQRGFFRRLFG